ncbi:MAG: hypothetical protein JSV16_03885 [Candidatus Hydrogenedentota bacterium]|nr:MAG: hypothetical protein JSV16_03885 [Candidatus Hydrogenedentota bacterium]
MVEYRYTRHQVARAALPDAETDRRIYLIKNVSVLHATYQVRLLAFAAMQKGKKLVLRIPRNCTLGPSLKRLRKEHPKLIEVERA